MLFLWIYISASLIDGNKILKCQVYIKRKSLVSKSIGKFGYKSKNKYNNYYHDDQTG